MAAKPGSAEAAPTEVGYPDPTRRALITISTMMAAVLVTLDSTIANVALPHIQSSISASPEQILWVVTSYVIAGAIGTPLSGWLATRYGRKLVMVISVGCFTLTSVAFMGISVAGALRRGRRQRWWQARMPPVPGG